jgi:hypothetical protein
MELCLAVPKVDPLVWKDGSSVDGSVVEWADLSGSALAASMDDYWAVNWAVLSVSKKVASMVVPMVASWAVLWA